MKCYVKIIYDCDLWEKNIRCNSIKFTYSFIKIEKYIVNRFFKLENIYESAKNVSSIALRKYKNYVIDCFVEI